MTELLCFNNCDENEIIINLSCRNENNHIICSKLQLKEQQELNSGKIKVPASLKRFRVNTINIGVYIEV